MKNFQLLFVLGLFVAVMGLVLLAEEPQGGSTQGLRVCPRRVREAIRLLPLLLAYPRLVQEGIRRTRWR